MVSFVKIVQLIVKNVQSLQVHAFPVMIINIYIMEDVLAYALHYTQLHRALFVSLAVVTAIHVLELLIAVLLAPVEKYCKELFVNHLAI